MDANSLPTSSKRQKVFERLDSQEKDVISGLPDDILVHLLTLLSTKEAIRTSILSKRWKCLWMSVGNFSAVIGRHVCATCVHSFLLAVTRHEVQELDLSLPDGEFILPDSLFISKSLSNFKLKMDCTLKLPSFICFSGLKELKLKNIILQDDRSVQQLFSGLPVLQSLTLRDCDWGNIREITIEIPTLKLLDLRQSSSEKDNFLCKITISSMNLKGFQFHGYLVVELFPCNLLSLDEATLTIKYRNKREQEDSHRLLKLLRGLNGVKSLGLFYQAIECLSFVENIQGNLPSFYNLTSLSALVDYGGPAIMHMVQNSPNLKSLIISKGFMAQFEFMVMDIIPGCFQSSLKSVLIFDVDGDDDELLFLEYLYEFAPVLERLGLLCKRKLLEDVQKQEEIRDQLQQLRRGSGSCRIEFLTTHNVIASWNSWDSYSGSQC